MLRYDTIFLYIKANFAFFFYGNSEREMTLQKIMIQFKRSLFNR